MPSKRQIEGSAAEARAAQLLQAAGYRVLLRNWRCRYGELDLIARRGDVLLIVEVRQRASANFGGAAASIDWRKRSRLRRAALHFLRCHPQLRHLRMRFDAVTLDGGAAPQWIAHAFDA
ncbi:MAG: YraN family protein [Steroidobacteraceae bacterium]|nr:YraN family protein [Steroidobacteraceae bacterium]MDW8258864.1 YraN family protein [Gammaproteobacteria bacterium]